MTAMRDLTYRLVIRAFRLVFWLLGLRFDVRGADRLPRNGPAILASNHLSYLDFAFVGLAAGQQGRFVRFMAKEAVFRNGLCGPLMRAMGHIPVDRSSGAAAYRRAARTLDQAEFVGIFPEATISRSWRLSSFKLGAATLAVKQQVPLYPVILWGGQRILTVDRHWSLRRGKAITVLVGEPLRPAPTAARADVDAELRRRMQVLLDEALRDYPESPADDSDRWWLPADLGGTAPNQAPRTVAATLA